jgi:hypothetical protein
MVPLLGHGPDISLDLLRVLIVGHVVYLEAPNVSRKLRLDDIDRHLPPACDTQLRYTGSSTRLLYALGQPIVSPDPAVLPPEVWGYNGMWRGLAEKELAERDNIDEVVQQEVPDRRGQEPNIVLELARLLLTLVVRGVQHD